MKSHDNVGYCDELITVLGRIESLHAELVEAIDRKIDRMRACDVPGMNESTSRERELVGRIGEQEGLRRVLTDRIGRSFGMSPPKARGLTATQLARKLPEPQATRLLACAGRLQELTRTIARRNRVAGRLSGDLLRHLDAVLSAVVATDERQVAYSAGGQSVASVPRRLFETVG